MIEVLFEMHYNGHTSVTIQYVDVLFFLNPRPRAGEIMGREGKKL